MKSIANRTEETTMSAMTTQQDRYPQGSAFATTLAGAERQARKAAEAANSAQPTNGLLGRLLARFSR